MNAITRTAARPWLTLDRAVTTVAVVLVLNVIRLLVAL